MRVLQVNAFTTTPLSGNPAGVVLDCAGVSTATMQAIARELNNPETAFVFGQQDHDLYVRYFTPTVEVPICGHATIAAHYAMASLGLRTTGVCRQRSAAGLSDVEVLDLDGDFAVRMHQGPARLEPPLPADVARRVTAALGLAPSDVTPWPVQIVGTGHSKVIVGVESRTALREMAPDMAALVAISQRLQCNGYFCFTRDVDDATLMAECRMFAPAIGIPEDPVTGNGHGPLGAYLAAHGLLDLFEGRLVFWSSQGVTLGRPGRVRVAVTAEYDRFHVEVGERAVIVFDTELRL